jgi:hypothetical protein
MREKYTEQPGEQEEMDKSMKSGYNNLEMGKRYHRDLAKSKAIKKMIGTVHPVKGRSHYSKKTYSHE